MEQSLLKLITQIENYIESFENEKLLERNRNLGIIYTPYQVVNYIVSNIFRIFFEKFIYSGEIKTDNSSLEEIFLAIIKNLKLKEILTTKIKNIRILDPSCGSGRFIINVAEYLYQFYRLLVPKLSDFDIKRAIIQKSLYGIEIENSAIVISKLRLLKWLLSTEVKSLNFKNDSFRNLKFKDLDQIIEKLDIKFNLFNLDFLLEFNSTQFDIIIGNPPYVENKKIKDIEFKQKLTKRFKTAYRLFDISILFIEKSLELLKKNGILSFILPNKFLSADYGIKIRNILVNESEIKEIINISSLPVFQNTAIYPVILSLSNGNNSKEQEVIVKVFNDMSDLIENKRINVNKFDQKLINRFPSKVIPISGNIELITYLYCNFKTFAETFKDLKIIYRPFGFLKYNKHFNNISDERQSENDLLLIGTGNLDKYHIKFDKRIKIAGNDLKISYFNYHPNFENIWSDLNSEKLIFREIAKDLTCYYDPGVFTNITGLYFIKIPSFNTFQLFGLLTLLNSKFLDSVFKSLFSTLHMAGGYLRFNGSFIKRLPLPRKFPAILSQLGKILQLLSQLKYEYNLYKPNFVKYLTLEKYFKFFKRLSNSLVKILFLDEFCLDSNLDYNILRDLLDLKIKLQKIPYKFIIPRFDLKVYSSNELNSILTEINALYNQLHNNPDLLNQLDDITKYNFSLKDILP